MKANAFRKSQSGEYSTAGLLGDKFRSGLRRNGTSGGGQLYSRKRRLRSVAGLACDKCRVLPIFSDPQCGPCDQLAPHLEQLHRERHDLKVLMVSRGGAETNRQKVAKLGLTFPVALQKSWEISLLYAMFATPMGYLIDKRGAITADVATGVQPILDLVLGAAVSNNSHAKVPIVEQALDQLYKSKKQN